MNTIQNKVQTVTTNNKTEQRTLQDYMKVMQGEISKALPSAITPERFTRMVLSAISVNPALSKCTPKSFLAAMMSAAQLGLEPNTPLGQAYLLPYSNHGTLECQFQIGYHGLLDLAYRSGEIDIIQAHVVYANDTFECQYGLNADLKHIPAESDRGEPVKVYAMFRTKSGGYGFEVMTMEDIRKHAEKYSKSYNSSYSPWKTSFEEMALKTVLKRVLKYAPLKSEFVKGVVQDETIKTTISEDMYSEPNEFIVDAETGEVSEEPAEQTE